MELLGVLLVGGGSYSVELIVCCWWEWQVSPGISVVCAKAGMHIMLIKKMG